MYKRQLQGSPDFYLGACVTPVFDPVEVQLIKMRNKIRAGAKFFQTQGVFDIDVYKRQLLDEVSRIWLAACSREA